MVWKFYETTELYSCQIDFVHYMIDIKKSGGQNLETHKT